MAMPPVQRDYSPSVRARRLVRILKQAREAAGFTQDVAATSLGWSTAKVNMIEKAKRRVSRGDVERMLNVYGVSQEQQPYILALAHDADRRSWWTEAEYAGLFEGPLVALEDEASRIRIWATQVFPGLLQVPGYARALFEAAVPGDPKEVERRLSARIRRQAILTRSSSPEIHAILDEGIIGRAIGGPDVLSEQLQRLLIEAGRDNFTVQIMPRTRVLHPGLEGAFSVFQMPDKIDPDIGYSDGRLGCLYLEDPEAVGDCNVAFEQISQAALNPQESVALIKAAATAAR